MGQWKAPGPDGVPTGFFQKNWKWIKEDLISGVLSTFNLGHILKEINSTNISLIPKVEDPEFVSQFRPISLSTVTYKIIAKCLDNRLRGVLDSLVRINQNAFIPGSLISDSILVAHELTENIRKDKCKRDFKIGIKTDMT